MPTDISAPDKVAEFFTGVANSFELAARRVGTQLRDYRIGDRIMRLEFAGKALVSAFTRAIAHLEIPANGMPDLHVHLWEIAETGSLLPPQPWDDQANKHRGEVEGFNDGTRFTMFHRDSRVLFLYDAARGHAYVAAFEAATLPAYERAAALRQILFPWLATRNNQFVHAAAVGLAGGGVLLVGPGGAGKSTTALACLDSDLFYAGDDYCALRLDDPQVYSLYNSGKANRETLERLPFLEPQIQFWDTDGSGKAVFFFQETLPHKLISQIPLRALLIPRVTGERHTRLTPANAHAALLALAPSTISQLGGADGKVLARLASLVSRVPCWHLELGTDIKQIPQTIISVLERPSDER